MIKKKTAERTAKITIFCLLVFISLFYMLPFYIIIITSFKTTSEAISLNFSFWPKNGITFASYKALFSTVSRAQADVLVGFKNTLIIVLPTVIVGLLTSSLAGYAFAKMNFPCKNLIFILLLSTLMIPYVVLMTPSFYIYDMLGLLGGSYFPLMAPQMFGSATTIFFMRQYFSGLPSDLIEAAKIDGMKSYRIFFVIIMPLSLPAIFAQFILGFIGGYNDYIGPLLYLSGYPDKYTLQIALQSLASSNLTTVKNWPVIMSGTVLSLIPPVAIFLAVQKYFIQGIATTGIKL